MAPKEECDLVMKGGVTSGTVYPKAICELARHYRLRGIGGTSAGAIAAAGAAAAEYWRQGNPGAHEMEGFDKLDALPGQLGEKVGAGSRLLGLFTPQPRNKALFALLLSLIGNDRDSQGKHKESSRGGIWLKVAVSAVAQFRFAALIGAGLALLLAWLLGADFTLSWRLAVIAALVLAGAAGGALVGVVLAVLRLPGNNFGLCMGMDADDPAAEHLTPWLYKLFQEVSGESMGTPLTFGMLQGRRITLRAVTSNLSFGHPQRLPFMRGEPWAFYEVREWAKYFPAQVMQHLQAHSRVRLLADGSVDADFAALAAKLAQRGLRPLPGEDDLPVVVAVRMSLSFPVLLSAVPLHLADPATVQSGGEALRCWFTDGGVSSNFPLHFFDSALPTRPTFAIDLQDARAGQPFMPVALPTSNLGGLAQPWTEIGNTPDGGSLAQFFGAIIKLMQNWRDNSLKRLPGYRDRVATVNLESHEGGLNLDMPAPLIAALAQRGEDAAKLLAQHFGPTPPQGVDTTWPNHCWVRNLTMLTGLERLLEEIAHAWGLPVQGGVSYPVTLDPKLTPQAPSYHSFTAAQRLKAQGYIDGLRLVLRQAQAAAPNVPGMQADTPRPALHYRLTAES